MIQFLLHFFPLCTIFLFATAGVLFFRYVFSLQKIDKHLESNRPMEWEAMGKPSVFSGKILENNVKYKKLVDNAASSGAEDTQIVSLWERSQQTKKSLSVITWSAFGMYFFTIAAVNFLLNQLIGPQ